MRKSGGRIGHSPKSLQDVPDFRVYECVFMNAFLCFSSGFSRFLSKCPSLAAALLLGAATVQAETWEVPLGGNAYVTKQAPRTQDRIENAGLLRWQDAGTIVSIYFRAEKTAKLDLSLRLKVPGGESVIRAKVGGRTFEKKISGAEPQDIPLGSIRPNASGYIRVDLQGVRKTGPVFAEVSDLLVASDEKELELAYVKEPGGNRFYWGRRGPSVHLGYQMPEGRTIEYFHSEVTVPKGQDAIGSYFMANGFGEGYFGMQVNGENERRVLFSIWSPFHTDNPKDIPEADQVKVLARGEGVRTGEFGNEGSGGQSFYVFPWKADTTYRFLNTARPDGTGSTIYTAWFFAPETGSWKLIASFKRPKTDKHLTGLHSFLENFNDRNGYLGRIAFHGNQWARDTEGNWHELTEARFTGDDIASRKYRLDYAGGAKGDRFFMRNGDYFNETVPLNTMFKREAAPHKKPKIDFTKLEAVKG